MFGDRWGGNETSVPDPECPCEVIFPTLSNIQQLSLLKHLHQA